MVTQLDRVASELDLAPFSVLRDCREGIDQARIAIQRFDPVERQAAPLGLLAGADVDVVEDLEVVGEELHRGHED